MFDGFWSGIFGGFFGPAIVQFLRRFRLRVIFVASALGMELFIFFAGVWTKGWELAWHRMIEMAITPLGILLPLGTGALCVVVMVICAPNLVGKKKNNE